MTVHSITTDLTLMNNAESGTWGELASPYNSGASPVNNDQDYFIQNVGCTTQALSASKSGLVFSIYYDHGSDLAGSLAAGDCYFFWQILLAGNAMDTWANGGLRLCVGNSTSALKCWQSGGNNFGRNPYGGWHNIAIDPTVTADYTIGSPSAVEQFFASMPNTLAVISKGNVHGVDALRYGRGELIIEFGDVASPEATFQDIADDNDLVANRWGLFQQQGVSFLWKGLMSFGNATNAVEFVDANVIIFVDDTPRTYADFNKIEINNTSSILDWTAVSITAQNTSVDGTVLARGNFEVVDNATVTKVSCTFTDMGTFTYNDGTNANLLDKTTWRRCNLVTGGGATFTDCTFDDTNDAAKALIVASPAEAALTNGSTFISGSTGHGIEIGGTAANFTLTDVDFIGYDTADPGTAANKAIYVNIATGTINITISGGSGISAAHHVRTAGATIVVNSNVTITVTPLIAGSVVSIYKDSDGSLIDEDTNTGTSFVFSVPAGTPVTLVLLEGGEDDASASVPIRIQGLSFAADQSQTVGQLNEPNFVG